MTKLKYLIVVYLFALFLTGCGESYKEEQIKVRDERISKQPSEVKKDELLKSKKEVSLESDKKTAEGRDLTKDEEERAKKRDLATSYSNKGDMEKAISVIQELIEQIEKPLPELTILSGFYIEQKKFELAEETLNKVFKLETKPEFLAFPYRIYGKLCYEQKKYKKAREYFNKSFKYPSSPEGKAHAYFLLAELDRVQDRKDSAKENLKKAIQLAPQNEYIKQALQQLERDKKQ